MAEERLISEGDCIPMKIAVSVYRFVGRRRELAGVDYEDGCQHIMATTDVIKIGDTARTILRVNYSVPGALRHHPK